MPNRNLFRFHSNLYFIVGLKKFDLILRCLPIDDWSATIANRNHYLQSYQLSQIGRMPSMKWAGSLSSVLSHAGVWCLPNK